MDNEEEKVFDESNLESTETNQNIEEPTEDKKDSKKRRKEKVKFKDKWKALPKKKKALIIIGIIVLIAAISIVLFFVFKKDKEVDNTPEEVTLENQNYRYQNGTLYFYDKDKNEIGTYECKNKDEDKCYLAYYKLDKDVDNTKYIHEDESEVLFQTPIVSNKYVFVYDNSDKQDEVIRLYDFKEQKELSIYQEIKKANDDYTFILKDSDSNYGIISLKDELKVIIPFKYEYLGYHDESKSTNYIALLNDKYTIIDENDKEISKPIKEKIVGYNATFIKVNSDSKYYVYDYKGIRKFNSSYNYVSFLNKYVLAVKNNMLYILDEEENNLNIDGLKLDNNYYCKTYIYDENNKLLKIVISYEAMMDSNNIVIDIYKGEDKENHVINALEATVNSKSDYVSYIDGKLYFYGDLEKKNKVGTYECKNKNTIESAESELTSCYLAKQIDGNYLPIINNRYVFINDTLDSSKQAIILYDLKDNKVLSNYLEVDASIVDGSRSIAVSSINIVARSAKKDRYGMINISTDNVKSLLEFSNQSITKINDYYVVNKSSGTYLIYDMDGKALTSEFANEIVSYNQTLDIIMTVNNNKYSLYKSNGNKITSKEYDRIDVFQKYLVGLSGKSMDVLNYAGEAYCSNCSNIALYTTEYNDAYDIDDSKVVIYNGSTVANQISFEGDANGEE